MLFNLDSPISSIDDADPSKFLCEGEPAYALALGSPTELYATFNNEVYEGHVWEVLAGSGVEFVAGGSLAPGTGTVDP